MIAWRTSRFLIYFFLILGGVVVISAYAKYGSPQFLSGWREFVIARVEQIAISTPSPEPTIAAEATPSPDVAATQPDLPQFPPVQIAVPRRSTFDQQMASSVYCDNCND